VGRSIRGKGKGKGRGDAGMGLDMDVECEGRGGVGGAVHWGRRNKAKHGREDGEKMARRKRRRKRKGSFEAFDPKTIFGDLFVDFRGPNKLCEGEFVEFDAISLVVLEEGVSHVRPKCLYGLSDSFDGEIRRRDHAVLDHALIVCDVDDAL